MKRVEIKTLFKESASYTDQQVTIFGWAKTIRHSGAIAFIELNDGSNFSNLQIVVNENNVSNFLEIVKTNVGASLSVTGKVVITSNSKQPLEIHAQEITIEGSSAPDYPLQKKRHTLEFLRTMPHLRPRTNTLSAVYRVRSIAAYAIHKFFNDNGYMYCHSPIITSSDCEGAGEMFRVTTLPEQNPPLTEDGKVDYSQDFFGKFTGLSVSGQLQAEIMALTFGKVYTFAPTFRAENSFTTRHAAEFWMIEPEVAFAELEDIMQISSEMIKFVISYVLENCALEMEFLNNFIDKGILDRLNKLVTSNFAHITYTQAIEILEKVKDRFSYPISWGCDLKTEHERYLCEEHVGGPLFVTDYPKEIKSFYMRLNDDGKTVAAMDMLVPGVGELIGGSQREERLEYLEQRIVECGMKLEDYGWYTDLRRYGSVKHSGYGLGFDRLLMYMTGVNNIRDVSPFPRTTKSADL